MYMCIASCAERGLHHTRTCTCTEHTTLHTFTCIPVHDVQLYIRLHVYLHRCVGLLVRVWALDVWGELVSPSKIFNLPFPVLKAGHSVSYSYICDVCMKWVNGWVSFYILS